MKIATFDAGFKSKEEILAEHEYKQSMMDNKVYCFYSNEDFSLPEETFIKRIETNYMNIEYLFRTMYATVNADYYCFMEYDALPIKPHYDTKIADRMKEEDIALVVPHYTTRNIEPDHPFIKWYDLKDFHIWSMLASFVIRKDAMLAYMDDIFKFAVEDGCTRQMETDMPTLLSLRGFRVCQDPLICKDHFRFIKGTSLHDVEVIYAQRTYTHAVHPIKDFFAFKEGFL